MVADALNVTRAEMHGVVTFYHDFRKTPPGRYVLNWCQAEACQAKGARDLAKHAKARLGIEAGETPDRQVTLENVYCLGFGRHRAIGHARRTIGRLDTVRLDALIDEARS